MKIETETTTRTTATNNKNNKQHSSENNELLVKREISWTKVIFYIYVHILGITGLVNLFEASLLTIVFSVLLVIASVIGITAGAHRLWAHRAYEANTMLRVVLMLCHTLAGQGTIHEWVVKHRLHHKHYATEEDPFNVNKGFWHSHLMAHLRQETPKDKRLISQIDVEDLENDAVVVFQKNFYWLLMPVICILLPVNAPFEYWGESAITSILITGLLRYAITCHLTWLIYSAVHIWGLKPGERYPADSMLVFILTKSHWLRYHHILPWDYQVGEFGGYGDDLITILIKIFASCQWATNLRSVTSDTIKEAVYMSTTSGKCVDDCVQQLITPKITRPSAEGRFHTAKFF